MHHWFHFVAKILLCQKAIWPNKQGSPFYAHLISSKSAGPLFHQFNIDQMELSQSLHLEESRLQASKTCNNRTSESSNRFIYQWKINCFRDSIFNGTLIQTDMDEGYKTPLEIETPAKMIWNPIFTCAFPWRHSLQVEYSLWEWMSFASLNVRGEIYMDHPARGLCATHAISSILSSAHQLKFSTLHLIVHIDNEPTDRHLHLNFEAGHAQSISFVHTSIWWWQCHKLPWTIIG